MDSPLSKLPYYRRNSRRVSTTFPFHVYEHLVQRSVQEGRSISNLIAYMVESYIDLTKGQ